MLQIYRFTDRVAVNFGGRTFYLLASEAREAAGAMVLFANNIERGIPFTKSTLGTIHVGDETEG